jgi:hypothetical protein
MSKPNHIAIDIWPEHLSYNMQDCFDARESQEHHAALRNRVRSPLPVQYNLEVKRTPPPSPTQQLVIDFTAWLFGRK